MDIEKGDLEIGERLKEFSKKFRSQAQLARELGLSPQAFSFYTNGTSMPGAPILKKLYALGCDINWLLTGIEVKTGAQIDQRNSRGSQAGNFSAGEGISADGGESSNNVLVETLREMNAVYKARVKELEQKVEEFEKELQALRRA